MRGLLWQFGPAVVLSIVVAIGTLIAVVSTVRRSTDRATAWRAAARIVAVGSLLVIVAATALPRTFTEGRELVLEIGGASLGDLADYLANPRSFESVLLVLNVAMYVPLAFGATVGWPRMRAAVVPLCLALSVAIESSQYLLTERAATTDDVILNGSGALIGWLLGMVALRRL